MREIKFRAWDTNKKEIREVTGINWYDEYIWVDETPMTGEKLPIETTPLMQFTGLKDKNGKEIYEGDVVITPKGICSVTFEFGCFYTITVSRYRIGGWGSGRIEVIGNIYESPELLNPKQ
jgi:uncharacterized phage protein (TIGR01671 family)